MFKIKVMQSPDMKYYWVMYSANGQVICRSERHDRRLGALYSANMLRRRGFNVEMQDTSKPKLGAKYVMGAYKKVYGF